MSATTTGSETVQRLLDASRTLSIAERIDLAQAIWETVSEQEIVWELTPEQRAELDRRWQNHLAHPDQAIDWDEGIARLHAPRNPM